MGLTLVFSELHISSRLWEKEKGKKKEKEKGKEEKRNRKGKEGRIEKGIKKVRGKKEEGILTKIKIKK